MKTKIYLLAIAALLLPLTACEDDYSEASSKHVYGENECPPLKGSDAANGLASVTLKEGEPGKTIQLADYADQLQAAMGMSLDECMSALDNGSVRFLIVNPNRRVWDKTPANMGDNVWGISSQGSVAGEDNAAFKVTFDKSARTLSYELGPKAQAGSMGSVVCGFVKTDDSSFPVNFRIQTTITVADLSLVEITGEIEPGDYNAYSVVFADYKANIEYAFGVTDLTDFAEQLDPNGKHGYDMYLVNSNTGARYGSPDNYTANGMGYWANGNYETCTWGSDGFKFFVEAAVWGDDSYVTDGGAMNIGRAPGLETGTEIDGSFMLVSRKDSSKTLTFIVHLVCQ